MANEIRYSVEAETDLTFVADFTAEQFGPEQELRYRDGLRRAVELLAMFPGVGSDRSHIAKGLRCHVHASHVIYYSQQSYGVLIERILGPGQDPTREFAS